MSQYRFSMEPHSLPSKLLLHLCSQHTLVTDYLHIEEGYCTSRRLLHIGGVIWYVQLAFPKNQIKLLFSHRTELITLIFPTKKNWRIRLSQYFLSVWYWGGSTDFDWKQDTKQVPKFEIILETEARPCNDGKRWLKLQKMEKLVKIQNINANGRV